MDRYGIRSDREGQDRVATRVRLHTRTRLGALAALAGLVSGCGGSDGTSQTSDEFTLEAEFAPVWPASPPGDPDPPDSMGPSEPKTIVIYLDLSTPMAGFLPLGISAQPGDAEGTNHFRAVAQWVPDHLTRVYPAATLQWRGVGQGIRDLGEYPQFERSLFDATATRLDLAIREAVSDLNSGRSEAVAVITDMLGTGELTGALSVSRYLDPWLASEAVRSGDQHLGLLGVMAAYWGGTASSCPPQGGLGCWFSERGRGWRRLEEVGQTPFYVLLMGRNAESLTTILESVRRDAKGIGIEAESELLTERTRRRTAGMSCGLLASDGEGRQYALRRDDGGHYSCVRSDRVLVSCGFDEGFRPGALSGSESGGALPEDFDASIAAESGQVEINADCGSLRRQEPLPDLLLDVVGTFAPDSEAPPWNEWSIETDDLPEFPGKTLQLTYFIEEVRLMPETYRAIRLPILRGGGS